MVMVVVWLKAPAGMKTRAPPGPTTVPPALLTVSPLWLAGPESVLELDEVHPPMAIMAAKVAAAATRLMGNSTAKVAV
jgi:hypothetical protein